eukprot:2166952-Pyramimonas_sp.AAC.1
MAGGRQRPVQQQAGGGRPAARRQLPVAACATTSSRCNAGRRWQARDSMPMCRNALSLIHISEPTRPEPI